MILALVGEESFLIRRELNKVLDERLPSAARDFNFDAIEGGDVEAKRLMEIARTFPVFSGVPTSRRVIWVKNSHELKKSEMDRLGPLLSEIPETTDLILTGGKPDRRLSFWQKVGAIGKVREFRPLYPREVPNWVSQETRAAGLQISPDAAQWLGSFVAPDLSLLHMTLQKLFLLKGSERTISLADVESAVTSFSWRSVFELTDAVGRRDLAGSLRLFRGMFTAGESPVGLLTILARHFRILLKVKEGESEGIPPFFLKDYQTQAARFDRSVLADRMEKIFRADWALKSSPLGQRIVFERLLMELSSGPENSGQSSKM